MISACDFSSKKKKSILLEYWSDKQIKDFLSVKICDVIVISHPLDNL